MGILGTFHPKQVEMINDAAALAEELVSNHYKMSESQWPRYDVKTAAWLNEEDIVPDHFAQVLPCHARPADKSLGSFTFDYYKICIQDHSILPALKKNKGLYLFPFSLYIITHELIHIVRFYRFLQHFEASPEEKMAEEIRVHKKTFEILKDVRVSGLKAVFDFYHQWLLS